MTLNCGEHWNKLLNSSTFFRFVTLQLETSLIASHVVWKNFIIVEVSYKFNSSHLRNVVVSNYAKMHWPVNLKTKKLTTTPFMFFSLLRLKNWAAFMNKKLSRLNLNEVKFCKSLKEDEKVFSACSKKDFSVHLDREKHREWFGWK